MTDIKDFIVYYPPITDKKYTEKISHLKEFATLQLEANEERSVGQLLNHQEMAVRYYDSVTPNNIGYIFHRPGVGKTHILSTLEERAKKNFVNGKPIKPALVLVRNAALRNHLREEIAYKVTKNIYAPTATKKELSTLQETGVVDIGEETITRRLNEAISKAYKIMTYGELLDKKKFPSIEKIEREYSNRLILIDEAQNIREQPDKKKKMTRYNNLHLFLHTVRNCRIYLFTGSPVWDKVYDIAGLLNLTLPLNKQLPTSDKFIKEFYDKSGKLIPEKAKYLKSLMKGKVTFLRPLMSSAIREEIGVTEPWLKYIKIYPSMMKQQQSKIADKVLNKEGADFENNAFLTDARDVSNGVYPIFNENGVVVDCAFGKSIFEQNAKQIIPIIEKTTGKQTGYRSIYSFSNPRLKEELGPAKGPDIYANISKYSSKLTAILKMLRDPSRKKEKAFIYLESVNGTGGALSYALIFQLWGFNWMKTLTKESKTPDTFIVVTSEQETINSPKDILKAFKIANGDDNIYGEKIRIVIGTEAIAQGYTLKGFRQGHFVQAPWNFSSEDQAMGRIFRFGAHDQLHVDLTQLEKNEAYLNIYRHAALDGYSGDTNNPDNKNKWVKLPPNVSDPSEGIFSTKDTVDVHIYKIAENKEHLTVQIMRLIKEISWDCALAYKRNVLVNDVDGSRECDFTSCNYQCDNYSDVSKTKGDRFLKKKQGYIWNYNIDPEKINPTNYNILYADQDIRKYTNDIIDLFHNYFSLQLHMIIKLLNCDDKPLLLKALNIVINDRIPIRNRYGICSYLKESNDIYFLDYRITSTTNYLSNVYTAYPFVTEKNNLEDVVEVSWLRKDKQKIPEIIKTQDTKNAPNNFDKLSYRTKIVMVEASIQLKYNEQDIGKQKIIEIISNSPEGKSVYTMSDGNIVHIMYNTEYTGSGYNVISRNLEPNGKMRVFDIVSKTWDYVDPEIEQKYLSEIRASMKKTDESVLQNNPYGLYGTMSSAGQFRIKDMESGNARTGRVCTAGGFDVQDVFKIFKRLDHLPYDDEVSKVEIIEALNKEGIIEILTNKNKKLNKKFEASPYADEIENMSEEDVKKVYCLMLMTKVELCNSLERWFKGDNPKGIKLFS